MAQAAFTVAAYYAGSQTEYGAEGGGAPSTVAPEPKVEETAGNVDGSTHGRWGPLVGETLPGAQAGKWLADLASVRQLQIFERSP